LVTDSLTRVLSSFLFFSTTSPTEISPLSLHDALPICSRISLCPSTCQRQRGTARSSWLGRAMTTFEKRASQIGATSPPPAELGRSEEHTSELQSLTNLVCRLLLEKKKQKRRHAPIKTN